MLCADMLPRNIKRCTTAAKHVAIHSELRSQSKGASAYTFCTKPRDMPKLKQHGLPKVGLAS